MNAAGVSGHKAFYIGRYMSIFSAVRVVVFQASVLLGAWMLKAVPTCIPHKQYVRAISNASMECACHDSRGHIATAADRNTALERVLHPVDIYGCHHPLSTESHFGRGQKERARRELHAGGEIEREREMEGGEGGASS